MADFSQLLGLQQAGPQQATPDPGNFYTTLLPQPSSGLAAASQLLRLNPQEMALYQRHLQNLHGPGGVDNPDGSRSSLYQSVQERNGRFYNIPTVWNGKIETEKYTQPGTGKVFDVPNKTALSNVERTGWDQFPSYPTAEEADKRYDAMHSFMEDDTAAYMKARKAGI
jgi:hypothetical protein